MPNNNFKFKISNHKFASAFTLIELLVVISIIAILIAAATFSYTNAQQKGRDNKRKSDLKSVQQSLELYFQQNGKYPMGTASTGNIQCNITGDTSTKSWGGAFICGTTTYMNPLPKDPTNNPAYHYESSAPNSSYRIFAKLENTKDPDVGSITSCNTSVPTGYTITGSLAYCVINP